MSKFRLYHNGSCVDRRFDTEKEIDGYIAEWFAKNKDLWPQMIYFGGQKSSVGSLKESEYIIKNVIVYQYRTFYIETFMILELIS